MTDSVAGTLSIPIRVTVSEPGTTREELLRLLKDDEAVRQAVLSLLPREEPQSHATAKRMGSQGVWQRQREHDGTAPAIPSPAQRYNERPSLPERPAHFARGLELFQKYRQLGVSVREQLSDVFRADDDFESFICCGVQRDTLPEMWDGIKRCLSGANARDVSFLQDVLAYFIELANRTIPSASPYRLLNTKVGDPYDDSRHSIYGTDSKKQGEVARIFLQGLERGSECVKKSLVRLE